MIIIFQHVILALILLIALITDLARHKVYNWLTYPGLVLGVALNIYAQGLPGLWFSLLGLMAGGLVFFPAFYWGGMGAGDLKLVAVVGAFMGWEFTVNAALYAALAGGVLALVVLLATGELWATLKSIGRFVRSLVIPKLVVEPLSKKQPLPYAAVIAAGVLAAYWLPPLLRLP